MGLLFFGTPEGWVRKDGMTEGSAKSVRWTLF